MASIDARLQFLSSKRSDWKQLRRASILLAVEPGHVFISYAREDAVTAERLYMDLRLREIDVWLDSKNLLPGQDWKREISRAIKASRYFLLLISEHSVTKRGFVQREVKQALSALREFPTNQVFLIPVRLDPTEPIDEELQDLNWVELYKNYENGLDDLARAISDAGKSPLQFGHSERAPIRFKPFGAFADLARAVFHAMPRHAWVADTSCPLNILVMTKAQGLVLPDEIKLRFPEQCLLVIQHQFQNLEVSSEGIRVTLTFSGQNSQCYIPYDSMIELAFPSIGGRISRC